MIIRPNSSTKVVNERSSVIPSINRDYSNKQTPTKQQAVSQFTSTNPKLSYDIERKANASSKSGFNMKKYDDEKIKYSVLNSQQIYQVGGDPRFGVSSFRSSNEIPNNSKTTSFKSKAVTGVSMLTGYDKLLK